MFALHIRNTITLCIINDDERGGCKELELWRRGLPLISLWIKPIFIIDTPSARHPQQLSRESEYSPSVWRGNRAIKRVGGRHLRVDCKLV